MKIKERIKNKVTTSIGILLMTSAVGLYITSKFMDFEVTILEIAGVTTLGWVFLTAKDTLLEGVLLNVFKIKK